MPTYLDQFTSDNTILDTDFLVGYRQPVEGGERRWPYAALGAKSFKNKLINGNFDIWQRGTTLARSNDASFNGFYVADRWGFSPGNRAVTVSRNTFDVTQTSVPGNPVNYLTLQTTAGGTPSPPLLYQRIENVRLLPGKTVTLSFYAKSDTYIPVVISYGYWYGATGSPQTVVLAGTINTTNTWQKYTLTTTLPSLGSGLTINELRDTFCQVVFNFPVGTSLYTFDIAQVQLEEGPIATPFEQRPIGIELALCQRYYEKGFEYSSAIGTNLLTNERYIPFKVVKRVVPTISAQPGQSLILTGGSSGVSQAIFLDAYEEGWRFQFASTLNLIDCAPYSWWVASAEL
jgi:hypothetical protein